MIETIIQKISNFCNKKQNLEIKEIESFLKASNFDVNIFPNENVIEFNKTALSPSVAMSSSYKYIFSNGELLFYHDRDDKINWLNNVMDNEDFPIKIKQAINDINANMYSQTGYKKINEYIQFELKKSKYHAFKITKDDIKLVSGFHATKSDDTQFEVETHLSVKDNEIKVYYSHENKEIDSTSNIQNNVMSEIIDKLSREYIHFFLTDLAKTELLDINSIEEYNPETHNEIIRMYFY